MSLMRVGTNAITPVQAKSLEKTRDEVDRYKRATEKAEFYGIKLATVCAPGFGELCGRRVGRRFPEVIPYLKRN